MKPLNLDISNLEKAKILLTGATGFIGKALTNELISHSKNVVVSVRKKVTFLPGQVKQVAVADLGSTTDWSLTLQGVSAIIHLAARVHIMNDSASDPLAEFRKVNVAGTLNLARQAASTGVARFVFISSIKVNGSFSQAGHSFTPDDRFIPDDPYGLSKYEAEQGLIALAKETAMEIVIIRPPLVYGPGVKGNFLTMVNWIQKEIPLPFGAIHNQRSLVALDNLVSFIIHCTGHAKAANEIFLISDGDDVSTTELLQKVADAFNKKTILLPVPVAVMQCLAQFTGNKKIVDRLFNSLQIDDSKAVKLLAWKPVISVNGQLEKLAECLQ